MRESHVHVEGALSFDFFWSLQREKHPQLSFSELKARFQYDDFRSFISLWIEHQHLLFASDVSPQARVQSMVADFCNRLRSEDIQYTEAHISPIDAGWCRFGPEVIHQGNWYQDLIIGWDRAISTIGRDLEFHYIIDLVLNYPQEILEWQWSQIKEVLPKLDRVVGLGIGGGNSPRQRKDFSLVFSEARSLGLSLFAHAGELGPKAEAEEEVRQAIRLGVNRIGHGIHGITDPWIAEKLRQMQIEIEICPSSNLFTRSIANIRDLPIPWLIEQEIPYSINSDDPTYFHTNLKREHKLVEEAFEAHTNH